MSFLNKSIKYQYDASGNKLKKTWNDGAERNIDYIGNHIYMDGKLAYILTDNGRMIFQKDDNQLTNPQYEYNITDHLGNVRVVFNHSGQTLQENSYYPFGLVQKSLSWQLNADEENKNRYLYNGKELQDSEFVDTNGDSYGLGWLDYGARMSDPALGRWHVVDPKAEKTYNWAPYRYGFNNPLKFIDIMGMEEGRGPNYSGFVWNYLMSSFNVEDPSWYDLSCPYFLYENPNIGFFAMLYDYYNSDKYFMDPSIASNGYEDNSGNFIIAPHRLDSNIDAPIERIELKEKGTLMDSYGFGGSANAFLGGSLELGFARDNKGIRQKYFAVGGILSTSPGMSFEANQTKYTVNDNSIGLEKVEGGSISFGYGYLGFNVEYGVDVDFSNMSARNSYYFGSNNIHTSIYSPVNGFIKYQYTWLLGKPYGVSFNSYKIKNYYYEKKD